MTKKKTHEEFLKELKTVTSDIEVLGQYNGNKEKISVKCLVCGHVWPATPSHLLHGHGCRKCADRKTAESNRMSHEDFIEKMKSVHQDLVILGKYVDCHTLIEYKCLLCGSIGTAQPYLLLSGRGCSACRFERAASKRRLSQTEFEERLYGVNPNLTVIGNYHSLTSKTPVRCNVCGYEWSSTGHNLLAGYGCPQCNHNCTSYPEQYILYALKQLLGDNNVISRDLSAIGKEIDIYVPSLKYGIEYGTWHFHEDRLFDDEEKIRMCRASNITLITVLDNCPDGYSNDLFWCYYKKLKKGEVELNQLVIKLCSEMNLDASKIDFETVAQMSALSSRKMTTDEFIVRLSAINPRIRVLGEYENRSTPTSVQCISCKHIWLARPDNLLHGSGCPRCAMKKRGLSNKHKVMNVDTGEVFESLNAASRASGISASIIGHCARGDKKNAGEYRWQYVD